MKKKNTVRNGLALFATTSAALALLVSATPQSAEAAATTAGATVYNKVTVTYASGSVTGLKTSSSVSVTVTTLAALPTLTVDSQTSSILSGTTHDYTYTIRSNSNGTDAYTITKDATSKDVNVSSSEPSSDSIPSTTITLWGGYALDSGDGFIVVPGGATTGVNPLAPGATVMLTVGGAANQMYTVASVTNGSGEKDGAGEVKGEIYLTPIGGAPAINGNVTAGTQVGEYKTFANTVTAGDVLIDPSTTDILDGTHTTYLHVETGTTNLAGAKLTYTTKDGDLSVTTTTILAPKLSILKESRNYTTNGDFATSGTTARPGEELEYRITVTNLHQQAGATINTANVADTLPSYTTYVAGSTKISYNSGAFADVLDNSGNSPLAGAGYNLGTPLKEKETATITYRATVN